MKAILIDPWEKSLQTINVKNGNGPEALMELYRLVGENGLDFCYPYPGESVAVGDHSALYNPPLPSFRLEGYGERLYGRAVLLGHSTNGKERDTRLSVEDLSELIEWLNP